MALTKMDKDRIRGTILDNATDFGHERHAVAQLLDSLELEPLSSSYEVEVTVKATFTIDLSDHDIEFGEETTVLEQDAAWARVEIDGSNFMSADWILSDSTVTDITVKPTV